MPPLLTLIFLPRRCAGACAKFSLTRCWQLGDTERALARDLQAMPTSTYYYSRRHINPWHYHTDVLASAGALPEPEVVRSLLHRFVGLAPVRPVDGDRRGLPIPNLSSIGNQCRSVGLMRVCGSPGGESVSGRGYREGVAD